MIGDPSDECADTQEGPVRYLAPPECWCYRFGGAVTVMVYVSEPGVSAALPAVNAVTWH